MTGSLGLVASVCQPSTLRMVICPEASSAQNSMAAVSGDGSTVWVLIRRRSAWYRSRLSFSWRVDETYVRVKGRWKYLYRAIDKDGATLDFYLADRRNTKAAKRFLAKALRRSRD